MSELRFHPLADIFPLMEGAEFDALVADIKANGLREPIVLYEGKILDGRNRFRACLEAGIDPMVEENYGDDIGDPAAYVVSANIRRRHLRPEQKRTAIAAVIALKPEASDRAIAKVVNADHKTVARARAEAEDVGKLPHVETRTDTKGRKQPVKKAAPAKPDVRKAAAKKAAATKRAARQAEIDRAREQDERVTASLIEHIGRDAVLVVRHAMLAIGPACLSWTLDEMLADADADADADEFYRDADAFVSKYGKPAPAVENAPPPDVGADNMRAQIAALDDGLDIPECLRRVPKAAAS
jgi:ParB-like nuclease domain